MHDQNLKRAVDELFQEAIHKTVGIPQLRETLRRCYQHLQEPMRVAIVGKIKAGKSTFMNALLEEKVVATGSVETTFNINWLRYGMQRELRVHYKDGRPTELVSYEKLADITKRSEEPTILAYLRSIQYIQVSYPNDVLRSFDLIDTPGLESTYEDDAKNTLDFIIQHGKELTAATQEQAKGADAILYLFAKGLAESDEQTLQEFQGDVVGQVNPFNAIGVLTKVDNNWKSYADPVQGVQEITQRLTSAQQVRKLFYTIHPVAGLLALGAKTLTTDEYQTMMHMATLPQEHFQRIAQSAERFKRERPDIPIPAFQREQLVKRLGIYGVNLAYTLINEQAVKGRKALMDALYERSGMPTLKKLIISHFGNRAYLLKLSKVLKDLELAFIEIRKDVQGKERTVVADIAGKFQMIYAEQQAFQEIEVLRWYYDDKLDFTTYEREELLRVTGEYGSSYYERLDMPETTAKTDLCWAAEERLRYWREKANDFGYDRATRKAATVIEQSYNRLVYELRQ